VSPEIRLTHSCIRAATLRRLDVRQGLGALSLVRAGMPRMILIQFATPKEFPITMRPAQSGRR
jgi:hypothetical protein